MIGIIAGCTIYGCAIGYALAEWIEAAALSRKICRESEEINKKFEELIQRELQRQENIRQILNEKLDDSTKAELEASMRYVEKMY